MGPVADSMANWLGSRPVILVDFREDRQVEVTLSVTPATLTAQLRSVLAARQDIPLPADEKAWATFAGGDFAADGLAVGAGRAIAATQAMTVVFLPDQPPDWVDRQLDADGSAQADNKLLAARVRPGGGPGQNCDSR